MTEQQIEQTEQWITTREAAELLGISADGIRRRIDRGVLTGKKVGRHWYVQLDDAPSPALEYQDEQTRATEQSSSAALIEELRQRIADKDREIERLWDELTARREAERELHVVIAQQAYELAELAGHVRALQTGDVAPTEIPGNDNDDRPGVFRRFMRWVAGK